MLRIGLMGRHDERDIYMNYSLASRDRPNELVLAAANYAGRVYSVAYLTPSGIELLRLPMDELKGWPLELALPGAGGSLSMEMGYLRVARINYLD